MLSSRLGNSGCRKQFRKDLPILLEPFRANGSFLSSPNFFVIRSGLRTFKIILLASLCRGATNLYQATFVSLGTNCKNSRFYKKWKKAEFQILLSVLYQVLYVLRRRDGRPQNLERRSSSASLSSALCFVLFEHFLDTMIFLPIYRFAADHKAVVVASAGIYFYSLHKALQGTKDFEERTGVKMDLPDIQFGFTPNQLREWYTLWGEEGRQTYIETANIDLFPYMESYTICMGALLVMAARRQGWKENLAHLITATLIMDVGETTIVQHGAKFDPDYLSNTTIKIASFCNKLKWILFFICNVVMLAGFCLKPASKKAVKKVE